MLAQLGGFEVDVFPVKFQENEEQSGEFMAMTFKCEKSPELTGKTLIIGGFKEVDDELAYEAFFDGQEESDALIRQHTEDINMIVLDIIQAHMDTLEADNAQN